MAKATNASTESKAPAPGDKLKRTIEEMTIIMGCLKRLENDQGPLESPIIRTYLEDLPGELDARVDGYQAMLKVLDTRAELATQDAEAAYTEATRYQVMTDLIQAKIVEVMTTRGITELLGETWRLSLKKMSDRVVIDHSKIDEMPFYYKSMRQVWDPKIEMIEEAARQGKEIPGVTIEPGYALAVSVHKKKAET